MQGLRPFLCTEKYIYTECNSSGGLYHIDFPNSNFNNEQLIIIPVSVHIIWNIKKIFYLKFTSDFEQRTELHLHPIPNFPSTKENGGNRHFSYFFSKENLI